MKCPNCTFNFTPAATDRRPDLECPHCSYMVANPAARKRRLAKQERINAAAMRDFRKAVENAVSAAQRSIGDEHCELDAIQMGRIAADVIECLCSVDMTEIRSEDLV
jgi:hypothetical protein